jgi:hypothetical protein
MSTWCNESKLKLSQEYLLVDKDCRSVWMTNVLPSGADFLENLELQHPGILRDSPSLYGAGLPYHSNGDIVENSDCEIRPENLWAHS